MVADIQAGNRSGADAPVGIRVTLFLPTLAWIARKTVSGSRKLGTSSGSLGPCPDFLQYLVRYAIAEIDDPTTVEEKPGVGGMFVPLVP